MTENTSLTYENNIEKVTQGLRLNVFPNAETNRISVALILRYTELNGMLLPIFNIDVPWSDLILQKLFNGNRYE